MIISTTSLLSSGRRTALLVLGVALALGTISLTNLRGVDAAMPGGEKMPALPVSTSIAKGQPGERGGPFVLSVKNDSQDTLKVSGKILLAVAYHMNTKNVDLPEHALAAGETWTISDLAAGDKVTLMAPGSASLEVVVK